MEGGRGQVKQQILFIDKAKLFLSWNAGLSCEESAHGFLPGRVNVIA
jgi:hypothetical protein